MSTRFTAVQCSVAQRRAMVCWQQPLCRLGLFFIIHGAAESRFHPCGKLINDLNSQHCGALQV